MTRTSLTALVFSLVCLMAVSPAGASDDTIEHTEVMSFPASELDALEFENISFAEFTYTGERYREEVTVTFTRRVETDDREEFEEVIEHLELDVSREGRKLRVRLDHPEKHVRTLFGLLHNTPEWRVVLDIRGPDLADLSIDADFSDIATASTAGAIFFRS